MCMGLSLGDTEHMALLYAFSEVGAENLSEIAGGGQHIVFYL